MEAKQHIAKLRTNYKIKTFMIFLILSAIYWFFITLSESYNYRTEFNLKYKNIPKNLVYQDIPTTRLTAQIKASGFTILSHKIKIKTLNIDVSKFIKKNKLTYSYLLNTHLPILQQQFDKTTLIQFTNDSLYISLGALKSKFIPIKPNLKLQFKPGFKLTKDLIIKPDSILVKGPEKFIDSIKEIHTIATELAEISDSFTQTIPLQMPKTNADKYTFATTNVTITGDVAKFTEGQIEVPISITNIPEGIQLEIFPKTALIKYQVAFEDYQKITSVSFSVSGDYPTKALQDNKTLRLKVIHKPDFITEYTIIPQQVNYLIKK